MVPFHPFGSVYRPKLSRLSAGRIMDRQPVVEGYIYEHGDPEGASKVEDAAGQEQRGT